MLHLFQRAPMPRHLRRIGAGLCLCVVLAVAGCSYSGPGHPYTLQQLHIPQLQWLPALSRSPTADGTPGGVITDLTVFQRPGTSTPQVILNRNIDLEHSDLVLSGIDGSGQHPMNVSLPCYSPAVTMDGSWIACVTTSDPINGDDWLQVAALSPTGTSRVHQIRISPEPVYDNQVWSPDGQYLAVVLHSDDQSCSVALFSSPPPHTAFTQVVTLTAAPFSDQLQDGRRFCNVDSLVWSADGQRLLVLGKDAVAFVATVPLGPLFQAVASASPGQVVTQTVPNDQVQIIPSDDNSSGPLLLSSQEDTVYYISSVSGDALMSMNLQTKQTKMLFTLPDMYLIKALTWMPNGRQLLLAVGDYPCVDCDRYAISDVYLYSPDATS